MACRNNKETPGAIKTEGGEYLIPSPLMGEGEDEGEDPE
jgi:hypothetical protein